MINVAIVGHKEVIARMNARRAKLMPALKQTITGQAILLVAYIQKNKLQSSPLHHRSGRLQASIKQNVAATAQSIMAKVYTNVSYARIHEYGGKTPAHEIVPKKGQALAFPMGGKTIFAKRVNHPGSRMPERSFMRSSLNENEQKIKEAITRTVRGVLNAT